MGDVWSHFFILFYKLWVKIVLCKLSNFKKIIFCLQCFYFREVSVYFVHLFILIVKVLNSTCV